MILAPLPVALDNSYSTNTTLQKSRIEFVQPDLNRLLHDEDSFHGIPVLTFQLLSDNVNSISTRLTINFDHNTDKSTSTTTSEISEVNLDTVPKLPTPKSFTVKAKIKSVNKFQPKIFLD